MKSKFKYSSDHSVLDCKCPESNFYEPREIIAYRWVHQDFDHKNNFIPVFKIEPSRIDKFVNCEDKCKGFGLSLFSDLKKAEDKLNSFIKRKPMLTKVFGNSIAQGQIDKQDGVSDLPNDESHFTLHEFVKSHIKSKFKIIKNL